MLNELLASSRFKSLLWRASAMALVFVLGAVMQHLTVLELDNTVTIFIGLVVGEITKALNNYVNNQYN